MYNFLEVCIKASESRLCGRKILVICGLESHISVTEQVHDYAVVGTELVVQTKVVAVAAVDDIEHVVGSLVSCESTLEGIIVACGPGDLLALICENLGDVGDVILLTVGVYRYADELRVVRSDGGVVSRLILAELRIRKNTEV